MEKKNGHRNYYTESLCHTNNIYRDIGNFRVENELKTENDGFQCHSINGRNLYHHDRNNICSRGNF